MASSLRPASVLATDKVRYAGEPLALVVAETLNIAQDALAAIEIEPLPAVTDARTSATGSVLLFEQ